MKKVTKLLNPPPESLLQDTVNTVCACARVYPCVCVCVWTHICVNALHWPVGSRNSEKLWLARSTTFLQKGIWWFNWFIHWQWLDIQRWEIHLQHYHYICNYLLTFSEINFKDKQQLWYLTCGVPSEISKTLSYF